MNLKSNKGSITLFVVIAMLAFVFFTISTYILLSRRNQTQIGLTKGIKELYGDLAEDDEYAKYFKGDVVPIYTVDELKQVGSGNKVAISKEDGKIYTFSSNATYVLKNDININDGKYQKNEQGNYNFNSDAELWIPIGSEENPFTGFFEGMGYTIKGIYISTIEQNQGLFGCIDGAIINNVKVSGKIASTENNIGGIVGKAKNNFKIRKCVNFAEINGKGDVGGIVGLVAQSEKSGNIESCNNEGKVVGTTSNIGGITGNFNSTGAIIYCINLQNIDGNQYVGGISGNFKGYILNNINYGTIKGDKSNTDDLGGIGGLVGINDNGNIKLSFNEGIINGYNAGGIVGNNQGIVENCYNKGNVLDAYYAGGIAGIQNTSTIDDKILNCYSIGQISSVSTGKQGGIVASNSAEVKKCCYLSGTAIGGIDSTDIKDIAEARSEEFMKSKYCISDLGGTINWKITNKGDYPKLEWQDGSSIDIEFETVSTAQALKDFAHIVNDIGETFEEKNVKLMRNVNLGEVCSMTLGTWIPIGITQEFKGNFIGNSMTISNLYINSNEGFQGLFGISSGNIQDLTLDSCNINTEGSNAGGIVAKNLGMISNCANNRGNIVTVAADANLGGIAGLNNGSISKCYNLCNITGNNILSSNVGGIVGKNGEDSVTGNIENCYNNATIIASNNVGGIAGNNYKGSVRNCYNVGNINQSNNFGGVIGALNDNNVSNCYFIEGSAINGVTLSNNIKPHSAEYMQTKYFVSDLGTDNWKMAPDENDGYPILLWQKGENAELEFETVSTAQALKDLAHIVNDIGETFEEKTITLMNNIDLSTVCSETLGNWIPIGSEEMAFLGTFNGRDYNISNVYIDTIDSNQGLFGCLDGGTIKNLSVYGNIISTADNIGGVVGIAKGTNNRYTISGCTNYIEIIGRKKIGGIVGLGNNGDISNCNNNGIVSGILDSSDIEYSSSIGGIVGETNSNIENCSNNRIVKGNNLVGGIVGKNQGIIRNSRNVATASVISENDTAKGLGGIAGINYNTIQLSYNEGNVSGKDETGGIVGLDDGNGETTVTNCYNIGQISGSNSVGGIIGKTTNQNGTISNSYSIGNITGTNNVGGAIGEQIVSDDTVSSKIVKTYYLIDTASAGIGTTNIGSIVESCTEEIMKSQSFLAGLGTDNWKVVEGINNGYPILIWQ